MTENEFYKEGAEAYQNDLKFINNPYKHGSTEWQNWLNGYSDASDNDFIELIKINPDILID